PDITAGNQHPPDCHVIVFQDHHLAPERRVLADAVDLLNELLTALVCRVCLSGIDHLDRPVNTFKEFDSTLLIMEEEGSSLIGREAACKADRECVRIKARCLEEALLLQVGACEFNERSA